MNPQFAIRNSQSKRPLHSWNVTPRDAIEIQQQLRSRVVLKPSNVANIKYVAGADISFDKGSDKVFAAVIVLAFPSLAVVAKSSVVDEAQFPYIPGLLSFREAPAVLSAWERLDCRPDVLLLDGQGLAHPRRFGLACHIGLWLGIPTVGCAKTVLVGDYDELASEAGSYTPLIHKGDTVGVALRTKNRVNPMFISPGHLVDVESSISLVMRCMKGYRVPEPTRQAHLYVNKLRRGEVEEGISNRLY